MYSCDPKSLLSCDSENLISFVTGHYLNLGGKIARGAGKNRRRQVMRGQGAGPSRASSGPGVIHEA